MPIIDQVNCFDNKAFESQMKGFRINSCLITVKQQIILI